MKIPLPKDSRGECWGRRGKDETRTPRRLLSSQCLSGCSGLGGGEGGARAARRNRALGSEHCQSPAQSSARSQFPWRLVGCSAGRPQGSLLPKSLRESPAEFRLQSRGNQAPGGAHPRRRGVTPARLSWLVLPALRALRGECREAALILPCWALRLCCWSCCPTAWGQGQPSRSDLHWDPFRKGAHSRGGRGAGRGDAFRLADAGARPHPPAFGLRGVSGHLRDVQVPGENSEVSACRLSASSHLRGLQGEPGVAQRQLLQSWRNPGGTPGPPYCSSSWRQNYPTSCTVIVLFTGRLTVRPPFISFAFFISITQCRCHFPLRSFHSPWFQRGPSRLGWNACLVTMATKQAFHQATHAARSQQPPPPHTHTHPRRPGTEDSGGAEKTGRCHLVAMGATIFLGVLTLGALHQAQVSGPEAERRLAQHPVRHPKPTAAQARANSGRGAAEGGGAAWTISG
ncbi:hypothetical protein QTO34_008097 [Cnephaeus nilssonii]|uniref:Uncharacterized protein n=1 Tax=Cnephaeus nilssonii TaxID=3371016 RepID=A0AA40I9M3_CNENI|nr:hypothetical protein QTO34_008097 [Eptesicus nilssonii]